MYIDWSNKQFVGVEKLNSMLCSFAVYGIIYIKYYSISKKKVHVADNKIYVMRKCEKLLQFRGLTIYVIKM